jgi:tetratricopeptide (TPR) repeat protein
MEAVMRKQCGIVGLGIMAAVLAEPAYAGVYSTVEPKWDLSGDYFRKFQDQCLIPLKQLGTPQAELPWQKNYNLLAAILLAAKEPPPRGQPDTFKPEERLDQAVCLLRIRYPGKQMPEKAILILRAVSSRDPDNFLVMSTLATAYQVTGDYQNALGLLSDAGRYWDKPFDQLSPKYKAFLEETMKWRPEDFAWFAKCERYQKQLVRLRFRELKKGPLSFAKALERLDPLFDPDPPPPGYQPLRFVGESGKFEPGKLAKAEMVKLPADAIEVVEQLLVWMPDDLRLYWLLGELLNAKGDVDSAKIVFKEFLGKFSQMPEFQGLANIDPKTGQAVIDPMTLLPKFVDKHPAVGRRLQTLLDDVPPPPTDFVETVTAPKTGDNPKPPETKPNGSPVAPFKVEWQTLGVGFGGGMLAGFLAAWRLRDLLGRWRTTKR